MSETDWNPNEKLSELILAFIEHSNPLTAHINTSCDIPYSLAGALTDHLSATKNNGVKSLSWLQNLKS
jgi:hypothetical protein